MLNKDIYSIEHIIKYCKSIKELCDRFGNDKKIFAEDKAYQYSTCMCILQIGEHISRLSDEAKDSIKGVQWRNLKAMRNIFAHNYGAMNIDITWDVITNEIPDILAKCQAALKKQYGIKTVPSTAIAPLKEKNLIVDSKIVDGEHKIKYYKNNEQAIDKVISDLNPPKKNMTLK